jgi:hypothetical protein
LNLSPVKISSPVKEQEQPIVSTRTSARHKRTIEVVVVDKQDEIVLKSKSRSGRGKKMNAPTATVNVVSV